MCRKKNEQTRKEDAFTKTCLKKQNLPYHPNGSQYKNLKIDSSIVQHCKILKKTRDVTRDFKQ